MQEAGNRKMPLWVQSQLPCRWGVARGCSFISVGRMTGFSVALPWASPAQLACCSVLARSWEGALYKYTKRPRVLACLQQQHFREPLGRTKEWLQNGDHRGRDCLEGSPEEVSEHFQDGGRGLGQADWQHKAYPCFSLWSPHSRCSANLIGAQQTVLDGWVGR